MQATREPIFGLGIIEELARRVYRLVRGRAIQSCTGWSIGAITVKELFGELFEEGEAWRYVERGTTMKRVESAMLLGVLFLFLVGARRWSVEARLASWAVAGNA